MTPIELFLFAGALCLLVSIVLSKFAVQAGVPVLLLFLAIGMLTGSDGIGGVYFDSPYIAQSIGVVALAFIIFSGGIDTNWRDTKAVLKPGLALSTIGVGITALTVGIFVSAFFGFTLAEGVLLGAIISSTDAAAVFSVLRGKDVHLKGKLKPLLELESGSNDPMAVLLTIGMVQLVSNPDQSPLTLIPLFVMQMGIGVLAGIACGYAVLWAINRARLEYDGLYPVFSLALVMLVYAATALIGGNGFMAVYIMGIMMARGDFVHKRSLVSFHDGVAWLMQIVMFVAFGLQVFPSRLPDVALSGLAIAAFLIVVARPISVFVALSNSHFTTREKLFISWVGLRGAAPIVLATFPLLAGLSTADRIFHLVFFIVLTSVLLQGTLLVRVAKLLGVYDPDAGGKTSPLAAMMAGGGVRNQLIEITVKKNAQAVDQRLVDLRLPEGVLIVLIGRGREMIVPSGSTVMEAGDKVLLVADHSCRDWVRDVLEKPE